MGEEACSNLHVEVDGNIMSTILNGRQRNSAVHASLSRRYPVCIFSAIV